MDLQERAASLGELKRFAQKFGVGSLVDRNSRRFAELGLNVARYGDDKWLSILADEPLLLVQPMVRFQQKLTLGLDESTWKEWTAK